LLSARGQRPSPLFIATLFCAPTLTGTNTVCTLSGSDTVLLCALQSRLPPEVNRILFVRNLPFKITPEELYDLFGRYGAIRQIRKCATPRPGALARNLESMLPSLRYAVGSMLKIWLACGRGNTKDTRGTAFVVYEDIYDAKTACDSLSGFHVLDRYLIVLYYQPHKMNKKTTLSKKAEEIERLKNLAKEKYGVGKDSK